MGAGHRIKYFRKKHQFTQAELAEQIISVPYLSLIENEKAEPPSEIIGLLANRLNVDVENFQNTEKREEQIIKRYKQKAKGLHHFLLQNSSDTSWDIYEELINAKKYYQYSGKIEVHLNLLIANYHIFKVNLNTLKKLIKDIKDTYKEIGHEPEISFELHYVQGAYHFLKNDYLLALNFFSNAERYLDKVDEIRRGHLFYSISLVNSILSFSAKSIYYGEKALDIFSSEPHFIPTLKILLIMGINYRKIGKVEEARQNFEKVLTLSVGSENLTIYRAKALHNLGRCEINENVDMALEYFIDALKTKQGMDNSLDNKDLATTLEQIANCYFIKGGPLSLALQYLIKVKELLKGHTETIQYGSCKLLEGKVQKELQNNSIATDCFTYALQVFEDANDAKNIAEAAEQLAIIFSDMDKVELTAKMLFKANKNWRKLLN